MQSNVKKKVIKRILVGSIILGILIPSIVVVFKKITQTSVGGINQFFKPKNIRLELKNIYSKNLSAQITQFLEEQTTDKSLLEFDPEDFFQELKEQFHVIKDIEWEYEVPQTLHLTIIGTIPYCVVNDTYILGNKHRLFDPDLFDQIDTEKLPHITINNRWLGEKINAAVYEFVHKIPSSYWGAYAITYNEPHYIELRPYKSLCRCRIFTDEKSFFEQKKYAALSGIFQDLCDHGFITQKLLQSKKIPLAFDFRIKNEIIVKFYESIRRGRGS
jgi:hypothetical protein